MAARRRDTKAATVAPDVIMLPAPGLPVPGTVLKLSVSSLDVFAEVPFVRLWSGLVECRKEYEALESEVQAAAVGGPLGAGDWSPAVGHWCLAEIDGRWHRCQLLHRKGFEYFAFLIDAGYTVPARAHQLREAPQALFGLPGEVQGYLLSNLVPQEQRAWSGQALEYLSSLQGQQVEGVVEELILPHGLVLLEVSAISKRLLDLGLAKPFPAASFRSLIDTYFAGGHSSAQTKTFPSVQPSAQSNPMAQVNPRRAWVLDYFYPQFQVGVIEPVLVTEVSNPHRIFCQLRSLSHEVQRLSDSMHHFYELQSGCGERNYIQPLIPGQPCACRGSDGHWYRSLLQEYYPDKKLAMVIHVDWGRKDIVSMNCLRTLAADYFRMPVVTFPCSLYGVSDGGVAWDPAIIMELRNMFQGKQFSAKIDFYNSYEHMYVVTLYGDDGVNLNCVFGTRAQSFSFSQAQKPLSQDLGESQEDVKSLPQTPPEAFYVPTVPVAELNISTFYDVLVEFVADPSNFWIRTGENATKYSEMMEQIAALYSKASKLDGIMTTPMAGQLCCTKFKDDRFYRAEIVAIKGKMVEVYFIDHGNTELVDWYNVKKLPAELGEMPGLAIYCSVADTYPLGDSWSPEAILAFKMAVVDKRLVIYVLSKEHNKYIIEVLDNSRIEQRSVGKILSAVGHAKYEEVEPVAQHPGTTSDIDRKMQQQFSGHLNKDISLLKARQKEVVCSVQENKSEPYSPFEDQFFEPGTTIEVVVSCIINPSLFWCQNALHSAKLEKLMAKIQDICLNAGCSYERGACACLAKSSCDGRWYRAFIVNEMPAGKASSDHVEVLFVDYGIRETVSLKDLRCMESELFGLKAQAFKCSLYNIIAPDGENPFEWDAITTLSFNRFVDSFSKKTTEFKCTFFATASFKKELFNVVDVFTPFASICKLLVEQGHAKQLSHRTLVPSVQLQTYYYSTHDIKIGGEEEVYITYVNSSLEFYCQLSRNTETMDMIASATTRVCNEVKKFQLSPGSLCLAKFSDQQWYRCFTNFNKNSTDVFFVDYGNTEKLTKEELLPIPSDAYELLHFPMQAIKCSLSDIPDTIPREVVLWFENLILDKPLKALIVAKETDGKLIVELYDGSQQINSSIKAKLGLKNPRTEGYFGNAEKRHQLNDLDKGGRPDSAFKLYNQGSKFSSDLDNHSQNGFTHQKSASFVAKERDQFEQKPNLRTSRPYIQDREVYSVRKNISQSGYAPHKTGEFRSKDREALEQRPNLKTSGMYSQGREVSMSQNGSNSGFPPKKTGGFRSKEREVSEHKQNPDAFKGYNQESKMSPQLRNGSQMEASWSSESDRSSEHKPEINASQQRRSTFQECKSIPPLTKLSDLPKQNITPGFKSSVYISHTNTLSDFYVQIAQDTELSNISEILNNEKKPSDRLDEKDVNLGDLICAFFEDDGLYYRAVITEKHSDGLQVQYIDYGNTLTIPASQIYKLPPSLSSAPVMSIFCALDKCTTAACEQNMDDLMVKFSERTGDLELSCEFVQCNNLKWNVILCDDQGCINDLFISASDPLLNPPSLEEPDVTSEQLNGVSHYVWNLPALGERVEAYASAVDSPEHFWCQLVTADVDSLAVKVQEAGERSVHDGKFSTEIEVGSPCNVIYSEDNHWYRAAVTKIEADQVTVRFVDYGNEEMLHLEQVRRLPADLATIPAQAFSCSLAGFNLSEGCWNSDANTFFYENVTEGLLVISVLHIQELGPCKIPQASVNVSYNGENVNTKMRQFWQDSNEIPTPFLESLHAEEIIKDNTIPSQAVEDVADQSEQSEEPCASELTETPTVPTMYSNADGEEVTAIDETKLEALPLSSTDEAAESTENTDVDLMRTECLLPEIQKSSDLSCLELTLDEDVPGSAVTPLAPEDLCIDYDESNIKESYSEIASSEIIDNVPIDKECDYSVQEPTEESSASTGLEEGPAPEKNAFTENNDGLEPEAANLQSKGEEYLVPEESTVAVCESEDFEPEVDVDLPRKENEDLPAYTYIPIPEDDGDGLGSPKEATSHEIGDAEGLGEQNQELLDHTISECTNDDFDDLPSKEQEGIPLHSDADTDFAGTEDVPRDMKGDIEATGSQNKEDVTLGEDPATETEYRSYFLKAEDVDRPSQEHKDFAGQEENPVAEYINDISEPEFADLQSEEQGDTVTYTDTPFLEGGVDDFGSTEAKSRDNTYEHVTEDVEDLNTENQESQVHDVSSDKLFKESGPTDLQDQVELQYTEPADSVCDVHQSEECEFAAHFDEIIESHSPEHPVLVDSTVDACEREVADLCYLPDKVESECTVAEDSTKDMHQNKEYQCVFDPVENIESQTQECPLPADTLDNEYTCTGNETESANMENIEFQETPAGADSVALLRVGTTEPDEERLESLEYQDAPLLESPVSADVMGSTESFEPQTNEMEQVEEEGLMENMMLTPATPQLPEYSGAESLPEKQDGSKESDTEGDVSFEDILKRDA
uniref:Tudor domain-containing 6 n=1 Tax=Xenopus tropicalis TaxID=8364 RepID=A0A803JA64_XENTR